MADTTYQARVQQKRDTAANWEKVKNTFQPLDGELIIVDTSAGKTRFKVGRYDTTKSRLLYYGEIPFADEYLYNDANTAIGKVKDELDKKFDKIGGTINGNVYISPEGQTPIILESGQIGFETINGENGAYFGMENRSPDLSKPVITFYGREGDEPVALAHIENPTEDYDAANKQYVDNAVAGAGMTHPIILQANTDYGDTLPSSPQTGQLFFKEAGASLFDLIYPVGAVYISMNNTSPATLFGGSWTKVEGKFLLGTSSAYPSGSSGGEETHTLTVNEMPSHNHTFYLQRGGSTGEKTALLEWANSSQVSGWQSWQTDDTGGGQAHNNMPPYLAVNIWYRVQ